jgi:hypothetical protein
LQRSAKIKRTIRGLLETPVERNDTCNFKLGFSRGAGYAYAMAGQFEVAGVIALDGSFKQTPYRAFDFGRALQRYETEARFADVVSRRGYAARSELMQRVIDDPYASSMDDRYSSAEQHLSETLYYAWGPAVLSNTRGNLTPISVLAKEMISYDWFFPSIQGIENESVRSQRNDPNTAVDDHFGDMTIPVIYFGAAKVGAESLIAGIHSAGRSGSKDVSIHVLEDFGHLDVLFASEARQQVYTVILDWIADRLPDDTARP